MRCLYFGAALLTVVGCAAPMASPAGGPPVELGVPATVLPSDANADPPRLDRSPVSARAGGPAPVTTTAPQASPAPAVRTKTTAEEPQAPNTPADPLPEDNPSPDGLAHAAATPAEFRVIGAVTDPRGDHGLRAPDHADLLEITFADDGQHLRVWVDVAGDIPGMLRDGEVMGLGVELFLDADGESQYQLFADGGSDGWRAYLHAPGGFVAYPGTFAIGGRRFEFIVPWSAIGDPSGGPVAVFLDWAGPSPLAGVVNDWGEDRAPDRGHLAITR